MITLDRTSLLMIAAVAAFWLVAAAWATIAGFRRAAQARADAAEAGRLATLVASAPAIPLLVAPNGRVAHEPRLASWLGLDPQSPPGFLSALSTDDAGITPSDAAALAQDVKTTQKSGRSFRRSISVQESARVLMVHGQRADDPTSPGGVILWFFDSTDTLQQLQHVDAERDRLSRGIEALSALIEAAPFPMWHRGPDLKLALVNTAYVRAVEAESAADVVERGLELVETIGDTSPLAAAAAARTEGRILIRTAPATIAGARRSIRIVDVPLGEGGVAGYAVDVEELEEARADLARFVRAQRDLLDRLSAGVAQFGADRSLVFFNLPFVRLFQLEIDWLADHPEYDRVLERMREAQRVPEVRDFPSWKAERRGWFTQGDDAIEEAWLLPGGAHLRVVAQPLPDGGLLLIFEDRTEQLQLASARDTLLRVRTATFDNLFEAIGVFAADGRLHLWNKRFQEVWELPDEELARHPRVDALVEAVGRRLANPARATLIRELVRVATIERKQRSGRVALTDGRHFEFAAVPLPDGNALFTMLDVTASRRIESALRERNEALEEADRLKDAFVANISYELRVPLTSIGGFAEMLAGGYAGDLPDTAKDYVAAILTSVERLGTVIEDVLDLTQSEAGSLPLAQDEVQLVKLVGDAAEAAQRVADDKGIEFVARIDPRLGTIMGDRRRLGQAFDHVLRNAISYTPPGGRVLLRAMIEEGQIEIVVSDSGPGMSPAEREHVFDRFYRTADRAGPRDGKPSTGLGLPLTKQLVVAHGGMIELASEEGEGTTVTIRLPRTRKT